VLGEVAVIAISGILAGVVGGFALVKLVGRFIPDVSVSNLLPLIGAAAV
jgi:hypothetical protein